MTSTPSRTRHSTTVSAPFMARPISGWGNAEGVAEAFMGLREEKGKRTAKPRPPKAGKRNDRPAREAFSPRERRRSRRPGRMRRGGGRPSARGRRIFFADFPRGSGRQQRLQAGEGGL